MQEISSPMPMTRAQHLEPNQRCNPEPFAVIGGLRLFETGQVWTGGSKCLNIVLLPISTQMGAILYRVGGLAIEEGLRQSASHACVLSKIAKGGLTRP
jgi:hypothetical protein